MTAIELENFWFALKPINMWIYLKKILSFCVCGIFFSGAVLVFFVDEFHLFNLSQMYFEVHLGLVGSNCQIIFGQVFA